MNRVSIALALLAVVAALLPHPGMYVGLGAGIAAMGWGWASWADRTASGPTRMLGATGLAVGGIGFLLCGLRIVLTLVAIGHLETMLG